MGMNYLKCDADGCSHVEEIERLERELIGKECPVCGANMLTEEDFQHRLKVEGIIALMRAFGIATDEANATKHHVKVEVNPRGGELNLKIKKVE